MAAHPRIDSHASNKRPAGRRIASGAALNATGGAATALGAFAVTFLVGRGLGPTRSASFFEAVAIFSILSVLGLAGTAPGLVWSVAGALAHEKRSDIPVYIRTATLGVALVSMVLGAALFLAAPLLSQRLSTGDSA